MKVHLIKKQTIEDYIVKNARSGVSFAHWLNIIRWADWKEPRDIIKTFNSADILGRGTNRLVFNVGGNNYRMICEYYFGKTRVHLYVKWIGTHAEYTGLCKTGKQYDIDNY
ncbi:type II toxin-antitoxin system HigB family toxin [Sinomicrobium soli]|uniref:type II toxin-antitoxin system HigB family toxin n=1 Tax=Sinomicrobium sp. N-1-3-6 TaxID=2219864 RepID=UPI000DCDD546|nr:type II toxin-antitoxin system HigB family toxin [Sinomicrobium sp. N-1-3-6]RAV27907.1 type II toxin-antitoxin system HigB family toxin [Sinomicrobium sp. N-1-3-6]